MIRGPSCPAPEAAGTRAEVIATELSQDGDQYRGWVVCAVDELGNEIKRVSVAVAEKEKGDGQ